MMVEMAPAGANGRGEWDTLGSTGTVLKVSSLPSDP